MLLPRIPFRYPKIAQCYPNLPLLVTARSLLLPLLQRVMFERTLLLLMPMLLFSTQSPFVLKTE
jgi:hypothetical protein